MKALSEWIIKYAIYIYISMGVACDSLEIQSFEVAR